ncbi:hypothetical protein TBR22_A17600 [Luteitalea sp. TBR-22]|uniref:hypothetical protein n=1 Tax=Luteitalea sp. TBR-22 TaxID=2802971 RepID=UPI001AF1645A|nr:hypothetical protein [Luteitalea sp. TBR-22]BCS32546.1 hypothetical protein TBR22_A17600 [Luteitalea sp. TBR-22]
MTVQTVRLYDASRTPRDWMELIQPGQVAIFATRLEGGGPCSLDGVPTSHEAATCTIADTLAEAESLCRRQADLHPGVRFDVFDAAGRSGPPLLTVVHPSRATAIEGHVGSRRRNTIIATVLLIVGPALFWIDWYTGWWMIVPTVAGFNFMLFAMRLLQLNAAYTSAERRRAERAAGHE